MGGSSGRGGGVLGEIQCIGRKGVQRQLGVIAWTRLYCPQMGHYH